MKFYPVVLDEYPDRRDRVIGNLANMGAEIVPVKSGYGPDLENIDELLKTSESGVYRKKPMTAGEIGCYYGHKRAIEEFVKSGDKYGMVFEDDFMFRGNRHAGIAKALERMFDEIPDLLYFNVGKALSRMRILEPDQIELTAVRYDDGVSPVGKVYRTFHLPLHAHACGWTREGAMRWLDEYEHFTLPVDEAFTVFFDRVGGAYGLWFDDPHPFTVVPNSYEVSVIENHIRNNPDVKGRGSAPALKRLLPEVRQKQLKLIAENRERFLQNSSIQAKAKRETASLDLL